MRIIYVIALLLFIISGCKSQKTDSSMNEVNAQSGGEVLTLLMSDNYGGTETEEIQVLKSQKELDAYFIKINMTRKPGLKPPAVDFSKDLVIAYCTGKTTRQGLPELMINEAAEKGMMISKKQREVIENQESTAILMPFGLYIMPITDKEINLKSSQER